MKSCMCLNRKLNKQPWDYKSLRQFPSSGGWNAKARRYPLPAPPVQAGIQFSGTACYNVYKVQLVSLSVKKPVTPDHRSD